MSIITQNTKNLDFEECSEIINRIMDIIKENNVHYKWVNGTLTLYPDNYHNTLETSRYFNILYISNYDNFYQDYDEQADTFDIDFQVYFNTELVFINIVNQIKNNILENENWFDVRDSFVIVQETRTKHEEKNIYISSLTFSELKSIKKYLKNTIKHFEKMNYDSNNLQIMKNELQSIKKMLKSGNITPVS